MSNDNALTSPRQLWLEANSITTAVMDADIEGDPDVHVCGFTEDFDHPEYHCPYLPNMCIADSLLAAELAFCEKVNIPHYLTGDDLPPHKLPTEQT